MVKSSNRQRKIYIFVIIIVDIVNVTVVVTLLLSLFLLCDSYGTTRTVTKYSYVSFCFDLHYVHFISIHQYQFFFDLFSSYSDNQTEVSVRRNDGMVQFFLLK